LVYLGAREVVDDVTAVVAKRAITSAEVAKHGHGGTSCARHWSSRQWDSAVDRNYARRTTDASRRARKHG
jgi:hypothetical protein